MSPYSHDFLWRHCIFDYNGYYNSLTYIGAWFLDSKLSAYFLCDCVGRSPKKGAINTINSAVNPALNSQQAIYYTSNTLPEQATETAR